MEKYPDDKKPVVKYTAKITLPDGEVIEKTVSTVGTSPPLRISTFLHGRAFSRILTFWKKPSSKPAENSMGNYPVNIWTPRLKKPKTKVTSTSLESESRRIFIHVYGAPVDSLQPKERVLSLSFMEAASCVCTKTSCRDAAGILNRVFHLQEHHLKSIFTSGTNNAIFHIPTAQVERFYGYIRIYTSGYAYMPVMRQREWSMKHDVFL